MYEAAVKLADGNPPTSRETTQAKREFLARYTRTQRDRKSGEQRLKLEG